MESRQVPLADVLSVTTPYLLSRRRTEGVCELVDWMTFAPEPTPRLIDLPAWHSLKIRTGIARRSLLRQHPQLAGLVPRTESDEADLLAWLIEAERVHGETLTVEQAEVEMRAVSESLVTAVRPLADELGRVARAFTESLAPALTAVGNAVTEFGLKLADAYAKADAKLMDHPDVAAVDAHLDSFYDG